MACASRLPAPGPRVGLDLTPRERPDAELDLGPPLIEPGELVHRTLCSAAARVNVVVGPMVMLIGLAAGSAAAVLAVVMEAPAFLALFIPAAMGIGAGLFLVWGARRARLEIRPDGFTWCGFLGAAQLLA